MRKLLVLAVLSGGIACASAPNLPPGPQLPDRQPPYMRVRDLAQEVGPELTQAMGRSKPRNIVGTLQKTLPKAGKYIRWGGNFLFAASLVNDALHWFYDEANRAANPALDDWWKGNMDFPYTPPTFQESPFYGRVTLFHKCMIGGNPYAFYSNTTNFEMYTRYPNGSWGRAGSYDNSSLDAELGRCGAETALADVASRDSGVAPALGRVVRDYIDSHPEAARPFMEPAPNENQYTDNPYADPTLDTDGDGVPDPGEFESSDGDPNDPNVKPAGAPYIVDKTTTTVRNPDGSITTTELTKWSDGKTSKTVKTVKKETTKNPDGSITTKKTTTTTTTDRDGKTETKTQTETETTPGASPEDDPDGDADGDGIPNKDDPDRKKELCEKGGGTWKDGDCGPKEDKEDLPDQGDLEKPKEFKQPDLTKLKTNWEANAKKLWEEVADKFPFGIKTKWFPNPGTVSSECPSYSVKIGVIEGDVKPCDAQVAKDAHTLIRPLLVGILWVLTGFAAARIAGNA